MRPLLPLFPPHPQSLPCYFLLSPPLVSDLCPCPWHATSHQSPSLQVREGRLARQLATARRHTERPQCSAAPMISRSWIRTSALWTVVFIITTTVFTITMSARGTYGQSCSRYPISATFTMTCWRRPLLERACGLSKATSFASGWNPTAISRSSGGQESPVLARLSLRKSFLG
ncbi:hypothetical protein BKA70DRAFT_596147 [Coprinopsis sp. MPI-PUGE-AT-0042]|nr:hypothetical protein BKA70DRAFT_596147 [Coprinopsis sp. MPI-PUGE-AT-0042]